MDGATSDGSSSTSCFQKEICSHSSLSIDSVLHNRLDQGGDIYTLEWFCHVIFIISGHLMTHGILMLHLMYFLT